MGWEARRILILGTTYPSYSRSHTETVCTGGIDAETGELVRIYPVPHRYLESDQRFKAFQWIHVRAARHGNDPRPESLKVDPKSIELGEVIPPSDVAERRKWIFGSPHFVSSIADLKDRQKRGGTSLGILTPAVLNEPKLLRRPRSERAEWLEKEKEVLAQEHLFEERLKPLDFPDYKFMVSWKCADTGCECNRSESQSHNMSLLQWGIHELARKYKGSEQGEQKIIAAMKGELDTTANDVCLFLGNFRGVMYNFGLMGAYKAPKIVQPNLFD